MTLQSYTGYLAEKIHINTRNKFITPIKNRGRNSQSEGLRFCPLCLAEDKEPYFRKYWRLSFVTTCPKHKCFLHSCCPRCHIPISPYKIKDDQGFCKCNNCHTSFFEESNVVKIPQDSYGSQAQKNLLNILSSGMFAFEREDYVSLAYFPVLKQIAKLIYNFNLRNTLLEHDFPTPAIKLPSFSKKPSVYVEDIPILEQYLVYSASEYLLNNLNHANLFCKSNNIGKGILTHSMEYIPYWYNLIIHQNDHSQYSISLDEAKAALCYLEKNGYAISYKTLSDLTGSTIDKRKRPDITTYIDNLNNKIHSSP